MKKTFKLAAVAVVAALTMVACKGNTQPAEEDTLASSAIEQAAAFAVKNSQGHNSENVPVDFTRVRFVKKPPSALPGKVIYTEYETVYIHSWAEMLEKK